LIPDHCLNKALAVVGGETPASFLGRMMNPDRSLRLPLQKGRTAAGGGIDLVLVRRAPEPGSRPGKGTPTPAAARPFREAEEAFTRCLRPPHSAMRRPASLMQMQCKQRHLASRRLGGGFPRRVFDSNSNECNASSVAGSAFSKVVRL